MTKMDAFAYDQKRYLQTVNENATAAMTQVRLLTDLSHSHAQTISRGQTELMRTATAALPELMSKFFVPTPPMHFPNM